MRSNIRWVVLLLVTAVVGCTTITSKDPVVAIVEAFTVQQCSHRSSSPSSSRSSLHDDQASTSEESDVRRTLHLPCIENERELPSTTKTAAAAKTPSLSSRNAVISSSSSSSAVDCEVTQSVLSAFDAVIDHYSNFLISNTEGVEGGGTSGFSEVSQDNVSKSTTRSCSIPAFGSEASMTLTIASSDRGWTNDDNHEGFTLYIDGVQSDADYEFLCNKLWDVRLEVSSWMDCPLDITPIRKIVADSLNMRVGDAPIGYDASTAAWAGSSSVSDLFEKHNVNALDELYTQGYTVIDTPWTTPSKSHDQMSKYLTDVTDQGDHVRRDKVHFLSLKHAQSCGVSDQYQLLMGVAHYLNVHYDETQNDEYNETREETKNKNANDPGGGVSNRRSFRVSPHEPLLPGTHDRPLSIPNDIQLAEYGHDDFYVVHSDNSLQAASDASTSSWMTTTQRRNHRHLTCILYMNDDWDEVEDGGALRIYPGSRNVMEPRQVLGTTPRTPSTTSATTTAEESKNVGPAWDHVDVTPSNGRMILFDSCLIHSVQAVTVRGKVRRALTIWIYRPEDSDVKGEQFY